ncbi:YbaB/EbfC family nucleoid-associated protein [Campylobacter geochelonis]|uniref:Nucleoid-associated protein ERS672216_00445 n=1 Tax=Campylobacter geochelonis TaxID=1780362 RepID=A0A128EC72_9BACT|nr:YbaB/EbfC family nucleoid-associated protein [Campylobacter geochelonis]QKF72178.1 YbaB/EbfC DNA-binding family protein [Campylobacter geochelonis]CZE46057.1 Transcriptional regulatory protein [Campylobacter geochelonis]CZE46570.1 Transcriptional regulatory protein [Campylobacter geochelonis]CZE49735.1 Transcriptional regulatory protein [Campylobacter geochelonis]
MFDGLDFSKMGGMFEEMQKKARELELESQNKEFSVKSGAGMVEIKLNGKGEVLDVSIDESLFEDRESLQILLISAMNDAIKLVENEKKNIATKMLGGLGGGLGV